MKKILEKNSGSTLIEVLMTISIFGMVIAPILSMFILAAKITAYSEKEYKTTQIALQYVEEIKASNSINQNLYTYNSQTGTYERNIDEVSGNYSVNIIIKSYAINQHTIEVNIIEDGDVIKSLTASKITKAP